MSHIIICRTFIYLVLLTLLAAGGCRKKNEPVPSGVNRSFLKDAVKEQNRSCRPRLSEPSDPRMA